MNMVIFMLVIYIYIYICVCVCVCVCVYHAYASMLGNMAYESDTVWVG